MTATSIDVSRVPGAGRPGRLLDVRPGARAAPVDAAERRDPAGRPERRVPLGDAGGRLPARAWHAHRQHLRLHRPAAPRRRGRVGRGAASLGRACRGGADGAAGRALGAGVAPLDPAGPGAAAHPRLRRPVRRRPAGHPGRPAPGPGGALAGPRLSPLHLPGREHVRRLLSGDAGPGRRDRAVPAAERLPDPDVRRQPGPLAAQPARQEQPRAGAAVRRDDGRGSAGGAGGLRGGTGVPGGAARVPGGVRLACRCHPGAGRADVARRPGDPAQRPARPDRPGRRRGPGRAAPTDRRAPRAPAGRGTGEARRRSRAAGAVRRCCTSRPATTSIVDENHNFYIDQMGNAGLRLPVLELGRRLVGHGAVDRVDDVFLLTTVQIEDGAAGRRSARHGRGATGRAGTLGHGHAAADHRRAAARRRSRTRS